MYEFTVNGVTVSAESMSELVKLAKKEEKRQKKEEEITKELHRTATINAYYRLGMLTTRVLKDYCPLSFTHTDTGLGNWCKPTNVEEQIEVTLWNAENAKSASHSFPLYRVTIDAICHTASESLAIRYHNSGEDFSTGGWVVYGFSQGAYSPIDVPDLLGKILDEKLAAYIEKYKGQLGNNV